MEGSLLEGVPSPFTFHYAIQSFAFDTWLKSASEERIFAFAARLKGCATAND